MAKVVGLEFLPEKEHSLAFQEVVLMRALRHPHIVALKDRYKPDALCNIVCLSAWIFNKMCAIPFFF